MFCCYVSVYFFSVGKMLVLIWIETGIHDDGKGRQWLMFSVVRIVLTPLLLACFYSATPPTPRPRPLQIFSFCVLEIWVVLFCWNPFLFPCKTLVFSSSFHPLEACWVLMSIDCALLFSFVVCHLEPKAVRHNLGYTQTVVNSAPLRLNSLVLSFLHSPTLTSIHDHRKNHSLD